MKRVVLILGCLLFTFFKVNAQSLWHVFPEYYSVSKRLRNQFRTFYYKDELKVERASVVNDRTLLVQLRCPKYSLEYKSEITVCRIYPDEEYISVKPEKSMYFLPDETISVSLDLSSVKKNGAYYITFHFYTELGETFYLRVRLDTRKYKGVVIIDRFPHFEEEQADENFVYSFIENMPEFPGGNEAMRRFVHENFTEELIPAKANNYSNVNVGILIDKDGTILYPEIVDSDCPELNGEALRIVGSMPKWKPASIRGKAVKSHIIIGIRPKAKKVNVWIDPFL